MDAAQLAPHRRINITEADVDYIVFSGHKLYAPPSARVSWWVVRTGSTPAYRTWPEAARYVKRAWTQ